MKNYESGPFQVGQKLQYCPPGTKIQAVTFVSMGPRVGKGVGNGLKDAATFAPDSAIVKDRNDNLMTVKLAYLKAFESK